MLKRWVNMKYLLVVILILVCLPFTSAAAASKLNLYYYGTKQNVTYTGQQVKYYYNDKAINMKNTPGIIIDGVSLASFNDVFVKSSIKMSYKYDAAKGILTLTQNGTTLVLTTGSKSATVNGKKVTLSVAPIKVKFKDASTTKLLVPARFVAETFGYNYVWNSQTSTASITQSLNLHYNDKKVVYTNTQGNVTINGNKVKQADMPSIIIDSTAMLRAWKVFSATSIGAKYSFNTTTQELTLTKDDTVVLLTMGSKTAYVNGKARTMDTAPVVVKNLDTNTSYVMVPGSFVASYLGYDYSWNSTTKTSQLTKRSAQDEANHDDDDGPELGAEPLPDNISFTWGIKQDYVEEYTNISNPTNLTEISEDVASTAYVYNIAKEVDNYTNKEVYSITSNLPLSKSVVTVQDQILNLHINNSVVNESSYNFGGKYAGEISAVSTTETTGTTSDINFNLLNPNTYYELTLSDDKCTLYVTLYSNYLNNITAGTKSGNDYIQISGMKDLTVSLSEADNTITLQFPNTVNGIGENYILTGLNSLRSVSSSSLSGNIAKLTLEKSETSEYIVTQEGTNYVITFEEEVVVNEESSLEFKLPTDILYADIKTEDRYYTNQIAIILPGNQKNFYTANPVVRNNDVIKSISINYVNSQTEIVINTTKLQGYKLVQNDSIVGVILGSPQEIYKNIVVLDAGHGGTDPGAIRTLNGKTINEKDINFTIMYELTQKYFNGIDSEVKAYYSRYDDTKVDLYERAAFAKKVGADFFISLHMNANNSSTPKGTEIYYSDANNSPAKSGLTSKNLANIFLNSLPGMVGTTTRNSRAQNYVVVRENTVPAILIELAFMSNASDLKLMTNTTFQEKTAKAIYEITCNVFNAYPTGR